MKLLEFPYQRPNIELLQNDFSAYIKKLKNASDYVDFSAILKKINALRIDFETQNSIAAIRFSMNTKDTFYSAENDFFDANAPHYDQLINDYYRVLSASKFKSEISKEFGSHFLTKVKCMLDTFHPEILNDLIKENELVSKYNKLLASAEIEFDGKTQTMSRLAAYQSKSDRSLRKAAADAGFEWMNKKAKEFDVIFDELAVIRNKICIELGYKCFTDLAYKRLGRTDYGSQEVKKFREAIVKYVVPLCNELRNEQAQRIGVDKLEYYDFIFQFPQGNSFPKGDTAWIIEKSRKIFSELSPEADTFFQMMCAKELMDLDARSGKMAGGYCRMISGHKAPFIFSNSNGSDDDIRVLIHELGHAFYSYLATNQPLPEYTWPTVETCEIHSMSLEFLTWPWTKLYFEEDNAKFQYAHLLQSFLALPYIAFVDEFQHWIYDHPLATCEERNETWLKLEAMYMPYRSNSSSEYLKTGRGWQRQLHIYNFPFYYIDYAIAQVCAFQFWVESRRNFSSAWKRYYNLCQMGGSDSFTNIIQASGVKNPFDENTLKEVVTEIKKYFEEHSMVGK